MKETKICVIGLGYVGLPLARLFSTKYKTVGFRWYDAHKPKTTIRTLIINNLQNYALSNRTTVA